MADLAIQKRRITGVVITMSDATVSGDTVPGGTVLLVRNDNGAARTVTVAVPGSTYGQANPDFGFVVPAGALARLGPFGTDLVDPADGKVHITYSAVADLKVAALAG